LRVTKAWQKGEKKDRVVMKGLGSVRVRQLAWGSWADAD
jgi:hypothetical protein